MVAEIRWALRLGVEIPESMGDSFGSGDAVVRKSYKTAPTLIGLLIRVDWSQKSDGLQRPQDSTDLHLCLQRPQDSTDLHLFFGDAHVYHEPMRLRIFSYHVPDTLSELPCHRVATTRGGNTRMAPPSGKKASASKTSAEGTATAGCSVIVCALSVGKSIESFGTDCAAWCVACSGAALECALRV